MYKILTINSHTSYHYLLSKLPYEFDIIGGWNEKNRSLPKNFNLIDENRANINIKDGVYDVILTHRQFHDLKYILKAIKNNIPVILTFHGKNYRSGYNDKGYYLFLKSLYNKLVIKNLNRLFLLKFVFIQPTVKASFNLPGFVIEPGIDINDLNEWNPSNKKLITVGNRLDRPHFKFDFLKKLEEKFEIQIVGDNPSIDSSKLASSFEELKCIYENNYIYINLLEEPECGYNLATLEAMATGMPIITIKHPESPISHNWNGLVVNNYNELQLAINKLLNNFEKAKFLGRNARKTIEIFFNINSFKENWISAIENTINNE